MALTECPYCKHGHVCHVGQVAVDPELLRQALDLLDNGRSKLHDPRLRVQYGQSKIRVMEKIRRVLA